MKEFSKLPFWVFAILVVGIAFAGCVAQDGRTYKITVLDSSKEPVKGAQISLVPYNENQITRLQTTDSKGATVFAVPAGKYQVSISKPGYKTVVKQLQIEKSPSLSVTLEPSS